VQPFCYADTVAFSCSYDVLCSWWQIETVGWFFMPWCHSVSAVKTYCQALQELSFQSSWLNMWTYCDFVYLCSYWCWTYWPIVSFVFRCCRAVLIVSRVTVHVVYTVCQSIHHGRCLRLVVTMSMMSPSIDSQPSTLSVSERYVGLVI